MSGLSIPQRANRVLNIILVVMLLIVVRVWHLAVVQHDDRLEQARRPQRRVVVQHPERGTVCDRFGLPLAVNRIQLNAAVSYAQIREIPTIRWTQDEDGKRKKVYARREHVRKLAELLADELELDADRVEDQIYSYAALFPNHPYVIKSDISEKQYYRLRMLERQWLGLHPERAPKRCYPNGRVACHALGYLGAIGREEYQAIAGEIKMLEHYFNARADGDPTPIPEGFTTVSDARQRLLDLKQRAYSIRDLVGKAGIEAQCDEALRGFAGRRIYHLDTFGNYIRELPGSRHPVAGNQIQLSLSVELQALAEHLLIENESIREGRSLCHDSETRCFVPLKQPWIKGGAIVALEPNTGEVLALASCPRFDPNDFIEGKRERILHWFETDGHVGAIWDGQQPLTRELTERGETKEEQVVLDWDHYLATILPPNSPLLDALSEVDTIIDAVVLQREFEQLIADQGSPRAFVDALWPEDVGSEAPGPFRLLSRNYDKLLLVDLCRLVVDERRFSSTLLSVVGQQSLSQYRSATQAFLVIRDVVRAMCKEIFHVERFKPWRRENGQAFLKEKRKIEREEKRYAKPYLDYFDRQEQTMFSRFWAEHGSGLMLQLLTNTQNLEVELAPFADHLSAWSSELRRGAHSHLTWNAAYTQLASLVSTLSDSIAKEYFASMRGFDELDRPLLGRYRYLRKSGEQQLERDLAAAFYPRYGFGHARSWAYRQATTQGSVFKIVTAYAALMQQLHKLGEQCSQSQLNPLVIVDDPHRSGGRKSSWNVGFTETGSAIPQRYKGGSLLRTHRRHAGEIDLVGALEISSNCYFGLLTADHLDDPFNLVDTAASLGYGTKTGIDLPGEYGGYLPEDVRTNRTGLYCFACGQHSLTVTPLQTAVMLATIANQGTVLQPHAIRAATGSEPKRSPNHLFYRRHFAYREPLERLGISFPIFTRIEDVEESETVRLSAPQARRHPPLPERVRTMLLRGLWLGVCSSRGNSRPSLVRSYHDYPWMVRDYRRLAGQIIGKTGTAESVEAVDLDPHQGINTYNHIWFASIAFEEDQIDPPFFGKPELVVIVYLRYGDYGREAAPLAAQIVKKWREIKQSHQMG